jgi:hypothetical protein
MARLLIAPSTRTPSEKKYLKHQITSVFWEDDNCDQLGSLASTHACCNSLEIADNLHPQSAVLLFIIPYSDLMRKATANSCKWGFYNMRQGFV